MIEIEEKLRAKVHELEAQLAAKDALIEKLREALTKACEAMHSCYETDYSDTGKRQHFDANLLEAGIESSINALAVPNDDTALQAALKQAVERVTIGPEDVNCISCRRALRSNVGLSGPEAALSPEGPARTQG